MRVKPVPAAPTDIEILWQAQSAVLLVPSSEPDCLSRLMTHLEISSRDEASRWLTFLHGLGLIRTARHGVVRTRNQPNRDALIKSFYTGIYGVSEIHSILKTTNHPLTSQTVFEHFTPHVPPWERHHAPGTWQDTWQTRVDRLLDWLTLLEILTKTPEGYQLTDRSLPTQA